jgi:hypothetical protein
MNWKRFFANQTRFVGFNQVLCFNSKYTSSFEFFKFFFRKEQIKKDIFEDALLVNALFQDRIVLKTCQTKMKIGKTLFFPIFAVLRTSAIKLNQIKHSFPIIFYTFFFSNFLFIWFLELNFVHDLIVIHI